MIYEDIYEWTVHIQNLVTLHVLGRLLSWNKNRSSQQTGFRVLHLHEQQTSRRLARTWFQLHLEWHNILPGQVQGWEQRHDIYTHEKYAGGQCAAAGGPVNGSRKPSDIICRCRCREDAGSAQTYGVVKHKHVRWSSGTKSPILCGIWDI